MEAKLKVKLLAYTQEAEKIVAGAAKLCYSSSDIEELLQELTPEKTEKFIERLMSYGHESPFEHISFTFGIEGVSRSLTHQLVRHRIASYSQKSQRYVKEGQFSYVIPPTINENAVARERYIKIMEEQQKAYDDLVEILYAQHKDEKKALEDARYALPNACETKIIVTMNARSLFNFFNHRCCNRAQWEIRACAKEMLKLVQGVAPHIFKYAGPKCLQGPCPEGKMTCGEINQVRKEFLG
ncbi:MAG: FAD-dependent thymidylate synthase [Epulopiscium sp.]|nr:FAD-dependent thymidylate synthase [Candidatus Epulonipiscium sp.]